MTPDHVDGRHQPKRPPGAAWPATASGEDRIKAVVDAFGSRLLRYAESLIGHREQARDAVQDTFTRFCAQEAAAVDGHVAEWLFTVCRNRALDVRRKERRVEILTDMSMADPASDAANPSSVLEQRETQGHMLTLMQALPENQREVLRLKFQGGLSYKEIAAVTKLSVTNVGFLIHMGIKTLRERMIESEPRP